MKIWCKALSYVDNGQTNWHLKLVRVFCKSLSGIPHICSIVILLLGLCSQNLTQEDFVRRMIGCVRGTCRGSSIFLGRMRGFLRLRTIYLTGNNLTLSCLCRSPFRSGTWHFFQNYFILGTCQEFYPGLMSSLFV